MEVEVCHTPTLQQDGQFLPALALLFPIGLYGLRQLRRPLRSAAPPGTPAAVFQAPQPLQLHPAFPAVQSYPGKVQSIGKLLVAQPDIHQRTPALQATQAIGCLALI